MDTRAFSRDPLPTWRCGLKASTDGPSGLWELAHLGVMLRSLCVRLSARCSSLLPIGLGDSSRPSLMASKVGEELKFIHKFTIDTVQHLLRMALG